MQTPRPGRLRSLPIFARGSLSGTRLISCERRGGRDETLSLSSAGRPAIRHAAVRRERGCVAGLVTAAWIELCAVCRRRQPGSCARLTLACPPFRAAGYCLQPLRGWPAGMRIQFLQHQFRQKGGQRQVVGRVPPVALPCRTVLLRPGERPARRVTLRACAPDARPLSRVGHSRAGRPSLDTAVLLGGGVRGQAAWSIRMPHCRQVALLWPPPTKPRWSISPVGGGGRCGAAAAALVAQESVVRPSTPPPLTLRVGTRQFGSPTRGGHAWASPPAQAPAHRPPTPPQRFGRPTGTRLTLAAAPVTAHLRLRRAATRPAAVAPPSVCIPVQPPLRTSEYGHGLSSPPLPLLSHSRCAIENVRFVPAAVPAQAGPLRVASGTALLTPTPRPSAPCAPRWRSRTHCFAAEVAGGEGGGGRGDGPAGRVRRRPPRRPVVGRLSPPHPPGPRP